MLISISNVRREKRKICVDNNVDLVTRLKIIIKLDKKNIIKRKSIWNKTKLEKDNIKVYLMERVSRDRSSEELIYWRTNNPEN